jgi:hypothetical protein
MRPEGFETTTKKFVSWSCLLWAKLSPTPPPYAFIGNDSSLPKTMAFLGSAMVCSVWAKWGAGTPDIVGREGGWKWVELQEQEGASEGDLSSAWIPGQEDTSLGYKEIAVQAQTLHPGAFVKRKASCFADSIGLMLPSTKLDQRFCQIYSPTS